MLAVDTNVIVRFLVNDDAKQSARARTLVTENDVFLPLSVLLECEWVLRSVFKFQPGAIAKALGRFVGLPTVSVERPAIAAWALDWLAQGIDFADALHLASSNHCEAFVTFDQKFIKRVGPLVGLEIRVP